MGALLVSQRWPQGPPLHLKNQRSNLDSWFSAVRYHEDVAVVVGTENLAAVFKVAPHYGRVWMTVRIFSDRYYSNFRIDRVNESD